MNSRLIFAFLWMTPLLCQGASFTSYFYNVEALTNVTARSAVRGLTGEFTNSITLNGDTRTAWPLAATAGTVINTGASTVGAVPRYTDTTGTNVAPSTTFNLGTSTNATLTGNLLANGATFTNGITAGASTFTGAVGVINGSSAIPSINQSSSPTTGIAFPSANRIAIVRSGSYLQIWDANLFRFGSGVVLAWSSGVDPNATGTDTSISRDSADTVQGGADSATATAFTFKGPDGSGADKVGGAKITAGGLSTGTAASGAVILKTGNSAGASSSSLNTFSERFHAPAKWVTLTSATATTIFTVPVPLTNYVGLTATVTVYATDGTDHQSKTSVITCDAINKAGAITETLTQVDNTTATSSGTLTATYDSVDAGSNVLGIRVAADSSLSETVLRAKIVITAINSNGSAAVTEQ